MTEGVRNDRVRIIVVNEINLDERLCLNFCPYYKPAKNDKLACMGFLVVETLIERGGEITFDASKKKLNAVTEEKLMQNLCIVCPFYEDDCDFIQQKEKSLPCGGFTLLGNLLEANIIGIDDIKSGSRQNGLFDKDRR